MNLSPCDKKPTGKRGFTLVELLIAMALFMLVMVGTLSFYLYANKSLAFELGRTLVNRDFRTLRNEMSNDVAYCNRLEFYSSYTSRTDYTDSNGNLSGNFILCIWETVGSTGNNVITKMVGYYQAADDGKGQTGLMRFEVNWATGKAASTDVLTLIPDVSTHRMRMVNCVGQHPGDKIFRNYKNAYTGVVFFGRFIEKGFLKKNASGNLFFTVVRRD